MKSETIFRGIYHRIYQMSTNSFNIFNFISFSNSPIDQEVPSYTTILPTPTSSDIFILLGCLTINWCHFIYTNHQEQNRVLLLGSFHLLFWPSGPPQIALPMSLQPVCLQTVFCQLFRTLTVTTIYFSCDFFLTLLTFIVNFQAVGWHPQAFSTQTSSNCLYMHKYCSPSASLSLCLCISCHSQFNSEYSINGNIIPVARTWV